jgi:hypothetical protein
MEKETCWQIKAASSFGFDLLTFDEVRNGKIFSKVSWSLRSKFGSRKIEGTFGMLVSDGHVDDDANVDVDEGDRDGDIDARLL